MIQIAPERRGRHQETADFLFPQVEIHRSPFAVRIVDIRIFIQRFAVEVTQSMTVLDKMHRNHVEDDADVLAVAFVDEFH